MGMKYLKPGEDFSPESFSKAFGFSGSATGNVNPQRHPTMSQDEFGDDASLRASSDADPAMARGGRLPSALTKKIPAPKAARAVMGALQLGKAIGQRTAPANAGMPPMASPVTQGPIPSPVAGPGMRKGGRTRHMAQGGDVQFDSDASRAEAEAHEQTVPGEMNSADPGQSDAEILNTHGYGYADGGSVNSGATDNANYDGSPDARPAPWDSHGDPLLASSRMDSVNKNTGQRTYGPVIPMYGREDSGSGAVERFNKDNHMPKGGWAKGGDVAAKKSGAKKSSTSSDVRSPTSTDVRSPTRTSTSTKADTRHNVTVTGGAGDGDTSVTISPKRGGKSAGKAEGGFIHGVIHHPGRMKNLAKEHGVSVHQEMESDKHSSSPSLRSAANLGLRLTGGDLSPRKKR